MRAASLSQRERAGRRARPQSGGQGPECHNCAMMPAEPDWSPPGVDTGRANPARVYDYWLGGTHNFLADQDLGRAIAAVEPDRRPVIARANRAFLGRAVRFLADAGIRQFLDLGSGIPTQGNVHEVAQQADPAARVVYVDIDPVAVAHSKAILTGNPNAAVIRRRPARARADPGRRAVRRLIDLEPAGRPAAGRRPALRRRRRRPVADRGARCATRWPPAATWCCARAPTRTSRWWPAPSRRSTTAVPRPASTCARGPRSSASSTGFDLVEPGLTYVSLWRPDPEDDVTGDPRQFANLVGVARKP